MIQNFYQEEKIFASVSLDIKGWYQELRVGFKHVKLSVNIRGVSSRFNCYLALKTPKRIFCPQLAANPRTTVSLITGNFLGSDDIKHYNGKTTVE